jgi:protein phosphatase
MKTVKLFLRPERTAAVGYEPLQHHTLTDVGIRRSHNQDAHAEIPATSFASWQEHGHVFIVADGMGGHAVGEKAAAKAVRDIPLTYIKHARDGVANALRRAFVETNAGIYAIGQKNPEFKGLGTTATALVLRPEGAWIAHVGDSRGYRIRNGVIQQLTFDHSLVWEMARRQKVPPEQLQGMKSNVIIRSLGPDAMVQVDVEGPHPLEPGDIFVLCSDGLSGPLNDSEIGAIASMLPPAEACDFLIQLANLRGGPDNITVQIVRILGPDEAKSSKASGRKRSLAERVHWSLPVLALGVLLVIATIGVSFEFRLLSMLLFLTAAPTIVAGITGLVLHAQAEKKREEKESFSPNINFYREEDCSVPRAIVERLAKATQTLAGRIRDAATEGVPAEYERHFKLGLEHLEKSDLHESFREFCRAMHVLSRSYNAPRNKPELFQPLWESYKAQ